VPDRRRGYLPNSRRRHDAIRRPGTITGTDRAPVTSQPRVDPLALSWLSC
jgi:hypothetical protein